MAGTKFGKDFWLLRSGSTGVAALGAVAAIVIIQSTAGQDLDTPAPGTIRV